MKIKILSSLLILLGTLVLFESKAHADDFEGGGFNLCIAQFPCHLKTGKLLPSFVKGAPCNFDLTCKKYRESVDIQKLQKKVQKQRREAKRRERKDFSN